MRVFEITTPDGRTIRQAHESLDVARAALTSPGYTVVAEIIGANELGQGGLREPIDGDGPSILDVLLDRHGDRLIAWLEGKGFFRGVDEPPMTLKSGNRRQAPVKRSG